MSDRRRDKKSKYPTRDRDEDSSSGGSDGPYMHDSRSNRPRDFLDVPHGQSSRHYSAPRRRDSDRTFPYTRDTGYSSAEISAISMSSAAYPFDPSSVVSASSVSRDHDPSPRPTTQRRGRHDTAQFSFASTPSSRVTDDEFDASTLSYDRSVSYTSASGTASAVPTNFNASTFRDLPSDDDDDENERRGGRGSGDRHAATSTREKGKQRRHSPATSDRSPCSPSERMPPQTSPPRSYAERHTDRYDPASPASAWWLQGKSRERERERRREY